MNDNDLDMILTGRGKIELSASSKDNYWIIEIARDGNIRFLKNMKPVEEFPSTPLTKRLTNAVKAIHADAVTYLVSAWEQGKPGPWDTEEGRKAYWALRDKIKSF
jgi:hypothetical protein